MTRRKASKSSSVPKIQITNTDLPSNFPSEDLAMRGQLIQLPVRTRPQIDSSDDTAVEIHPVRELDSLIVSVKPPQLPVSGLNRATCDIILVIDVSGSMSSAAPVPDAGDGGDRESAGLSVLDLVKHAAKTILETLGSRDRLGIVTFSDDAEIVQELVYMTPGEKANTAQRIEKLREQSCTNLWAGIRTGLDMFQHTDLIDNVQGLYVLTDGMPNHMCPKQGYVNKIRPMLKDAIVKRSTAPTIHTFGFGYSIRSELMQSIAEIGHGSYAFIPDAGMIGTAFVHSAANLYSTLGTSTKLEIKLSGDVPFKATSGMSLQAGEYGSFLELGNLQYGQSRDLVLICPDGIPDDTTITVKLTYRTATRALRCAQAAAVFSDTPSLDPGLACYHMHRAQICTYLSSLFPLQENGEHTTLSKPSDLNNARASLSTIAKSLQSSEFSDRPNVRSLLDDLVGDEPHGQVLKALQDGSEGYQNNFWKKWGRHYLPSLLHAHQRQACNTFKDPGPLLYGKDSPLFIKCRDELDAAFDNLPPPKPSRPEKVVHTYDRNGAVTGTVRIPHRERSMRSWNSRSTPCFEGNCLVTMGGGEKLPIKNLKPGMLVWTPLGSRAIAAIVRTKVRGEKQKLCRIGELLVTPWHPIKREGRWVFPAQVAQRSFSFKGSVYSILLAPFQHAEGHAIEIGGQVCVTLGHGLVGRSKNDVRAHPFFGNYGRVVVAALRLPMDRNQHLRCGGMLRDRKTGLGCGFARPEVVRSVAKGLRMGVKRRCLA